MRFLFEAAVMGGAPIFSLFREALPAARLERFRGVLNSTTNLILTETEQGISFEAAVKKAQDLGIAETDPGFDVDGWDATGQRAGVGADGLLAQANDIAREGIRGIRMEMVQSARIMSRRYKLVCQAVKRADGTVEGSVRPEQVPISDDPLAGCDGATSTLAPAASAGVILFQMGVIHGWTLSEIHPDAVTTAHGQLADFATIARG